MKHTGLLLWVMAGCIAAGPVRADRRSAQVAELTRNGQSALRDGLWDLGETYFNQALTLARSRDERLAALRGLAKTLIEQRRCDDALQRLDDALATVPAGDVRVDLLLLRSRALLPTRPDEALSTVRDVLPLLKPDQPLHGAALRALGQALDRTGSLVDAEAAFHAFADAWPNDPEADVNRVEWASVLARLNRLPEAEALLRAAAATPSNPPASRLARMRLADVLAKEQRNAEAQTVLKDFLAAQTITPNERAEAWMFLARLQNDGGAPRQAADTLKTALDEDLPPTLKHSMALLRGRLLLESGDLEGGKTLIREQVMLAPERDESAQAQLFLARRLGAAEQWEAALREYLRFLETYPARSETPAARLERADCLYHLSRYTEAAAEYDRIAEQSEAGSALKLSALRGAADSRFLLDATDLAIRLYRQLIAQTTNTATVIECEFQIAEALRRAARAEDAQTEFQAFLDHHPDAPLADSARLRLAMISEDQERWNEAIERYGRLIGQTPRSAEEARAILSRGLIRYRLGRFDEALTDFEKTGKEHPGTPYSEQAFFMQGWCHALLGRTDRALELCGQFVQEFPESKWTPDVQFWIGETHFNRGEYDAAEKAFDAPGLQRPGGPLADRALFWAGRSAMHAHNDLHALDYFTKLLGDYPDSPMRQDARFAQGEALRNSGQFAAAILAFQEILLRHPDSHLADPARLQIGDCHYTLAAEDASRYEQAIASYRDLRDSPKAPPDLRLEAEYKTGRCRERLGRKADALESYMNVVYEHEDALRNGRPGSDPWFARAAFAAGALLEEKTAWREASALYRRVIESGSASSAEAQERLSRIRFEPWMTRDKEHES